MSDAIAAQRDAVRSIQRLRIMAIVEATTLLMLVLVAVPLKHVFGIPTVSRIMGPVHGLAFVAYMWCLIAAVSADGWRRAEVVRLVLTAFVPFGGFANHSMLRAKAAAVAHEQPV